MECVRSLFLALLVLSASTRILYSHHQPVLRSSKDSGFLLFEVDGKVGLKDSEGHVLIPAVYDAIGWSNGQLSIVDRVVGYQRNGLWGLITTSNKIVTEAEYLEIRPGEGSFILAQKRSLSQRPSFGVINTSGKVVIPFIYDDLHISNMRAIVMSRIGTRFLFGMSDLSHKILIPVRYQRIYSLGSLRYAVENFEGKTAIFSDNGSQVTPFNIDSISNFRNDYAIIYKDRRQGLINRNGQLAVQPVYGEVQLDEAGNVLVRECHEWLFLRGDNTLINRFRADGLTPLSADRYAIRDGGKMQLAGNDLIPLHNDLFSFIGEFRNGMALCRKGTRAGVLSTAGQLIIPAEYTAVEMESNGFRAHLDAGEKKGWVLLDHVGNTLTEKAYEHIAPFNGKFYPAKRRGYWGALNAEGCEIVTCVHDSIVQELDNNIVVKFKGAYGVMNLHERWLVSPQENRLQLLNDSTYLEFGDKITFVKSVSGELIYFSEYPLKLEGRYVREELPSGGHWLVNMNGIVIDRSNQPPDADIIFSESEGLRAIRKDGKFGFVDNEGQLRIANRYEAVQPFSEGLAAIRILGRWGFIDHQERLVIQPVYERVEDFDHGTAIVMQDGRWGLIDGDGKVILPLRYDEIKRNGFGRYILRAGGLYGMADSAGKVIIHPKYDAVEDTGTGYAIVQRDDKSGVLTLQGVSTIPMIYDGLSYDRDRDQFLALKKSEWQKLK